MKKFVWAALIVVSLFAVGCKEDTGGTESGTGTNGGSSSSSTEGGSSSSSTESGS
jgi:hypothetical protein